MESQSDVGGGDTATPHSMPGLLNKTGRANDRYRSHTAQTDQRPALDPRDGVMSSPAIFTNKPAICSTERVPMGKSPLYGISLPRLHISLAASWHISHRGYERLAHRERSLSVHSSGCEQPGRGIGRCTEIYQALSHIKITFPTAMRPGSTAPQRGPKMITMQDRCKTTHLDTISTNSPSGP